MPASGREVEWTPNCSQVASDSPQLTMAASQVQSDAQHGHLINCQVPAQACIIAYQCATLHASLQRRTGVGGHGHAFVTSPSPSISFTGCVAWHPLTPTQPASSSHLQ